MCYWWKRRKFGFRQSALETGVDESSTKAWDPFEYAKALSLDNESLSLSDIIYSITYSFNVGIVYNSSSNLDLNSVLYIWICVL